MTIHELETPAVLIDMEILDRNLHRMADYCAAHRLVLRPHTKTHKIPQIAKLQMGFGAPGITVAKLGEAEAMAEAGIEDILIVYPLWGEKKWRRLADLAQRVRMSVAMDSLEVAEGISRAAKLVGVEVGIRLEFDTGFGRCGLSANEASMSIAKRIAALPNLRWEGISLYPGHIMGDRQIREQDIATENLRLDDLYALLDSNGIPHPVVSGGNTPAAFESHRFHGLTEIRPGTYVFNDRNTVDAESATYVDCAVTVLATVVSTSVPGKAIVDAGSKTLSADSLLSGERKHFGYIQNHPELVLEDLSEEHGHITIPPECKLKIGDRLRIVPNHVCPCINLHDRAFAISGERIEGQWTIAGRGKVA